MNEARRAITEGGAYVNNERVTDADAAVARRTCCTAGTWCCAAGKRTFAGVELRGDPRPASADRIAPEDCRSPDVTRDACRRDLTIDSRRTA